MFGNVSNNSCIEAFLDRRGCPSQTNSEAILQPGPGNLLGVFAEDLDFGVQTGKSAQGIHKFLFDWPKAWYVSRQKPSCTWSLLNFGAGHRDVRLAAGGSALSALYERPVEGSARAGWGAGAPQDSAPIPFQTGGTYSHLVRNLRLSLKEPFRRAL